MGKKLCLILTLCMLSVGMAFAQKTVTGTVYEAATGDPILGATVRVQGTSIGSTTDANGNFTIKNVPNDATSLLITYLGMQDVDVAIKPNVKVSMKEDTKLLDEVFVVAYGTATKATFTGSAGVMDAAAIENRQISNVTNALAGNVAGVTAYKANGQPGTSSSIRIRGFGSINASMAPLYVVDGMPFDGDISAIDPQDIEQITVQKDAAATALYGARGANGVIMVKTKSGQRNTDAKVTFEASWGANSREFKNQKVISNTNQFYEQLYRTNYNNALYNMGYSAMDAHNYANKVVPDVTGYNIYTVPNGEGLFNVGGKINPNAKLGYEEGSYYYTPDDWAKESFHNGMRQEYKASVSGGSDKLTYYFGLGYLNDEGVIKNSGFDRISTRSNVEYQAKEWLKLTANLSYTNSKSSYPGEQTTSNSSGNVFGLVNQLGPVYPFYVRNADGTIARNGSNGKKVYDYGDGSSTPYTRNVFSIANPIGDLTYQTEEYLMDIFNSRWGVEITPVRGLTLSAKLGMNLDNTRYHYASSSQYGQSASYGGEAVQEHTHQLEITQQYLANYRRTFADVHSIDAFVAYENYDWQSENSEAYGQNLYREGSWAVNNSIDQRRGYGSESKYATRSWLGRFNYDYAEKYFASLSLRRDGTSRLNDCGTFWSASAAWTISKEKFMENVSWIDFLKLRASFGQNGNDNLGNNYAYIDQFTMTGSDGVFSDGTLAYKGNPDLKWEKTNSFDLAVDFELFKGFLTGSFDYYSRATKDMLYYNPCPPSLGYSSIPMNIGSMRNRGIELDLHARVINTHDVKWLIDFNINHNSNKILKLAPDLEGQLIDGSRIYKEGKSMYQYYLVKYAGVDPTTGMALYWAKDDQGNEYATTAYTTARTTNRQATGNMQAKFIGGVGTTLDFYGFDLSIQCNYQFGGKLYDNGYQNLMHNGGTSNAGNAWHKDILKAWTPENPNTDVPRIATADLYTNSTSDRFLISSNYFSINNITLGYTIPKTITRRIQLDAVRIFGSADNLVVFSARKGMDPRMGVISTDNRYYSALRTFTGGIKLVF